MEVRVDTLKPIDNIYTVTSYSVAIGSYPEAHRKCGCLWASEAHRKADACGHLKHIEKRMLVGI